MGLQVEVFYEGKQKEKIRNDRRDLQLCSPFERTSQTYPRMYRCCRGEPTDKDDGMCDETGEKSHAYYSAD